MFKPIYIKVSCQPVIVWACLCVIVTSSFYSLSTHTHTHMPHASGEKAQNNSTNKNSVAVLNKLKIVLSSYVSLLLYFTVQQLSAVVMAKLCHIDCLRV